MANSENENAEGAESTQSAPSPAEAPKTPEPRVGHHAGFGCAIFIAAGVIFLGIIAWSFYTFSKQDSEIDKFTVDEEVKTRIPEATEAQLAAFAEKITQFSEAARNKEKAEISFTPEELNLFLLHEPDLVFYQGLVYVTSIKPDGLIGADFSLPLNRKQFWKGPRYLERRGHFELTYQKEEFRMYLLLHDLNAKGQPVPEGFIFNAEHWPWLTPYYDHDEKKKTLLQITGIAFEEGKLTIFANGAGNTTSLDKEVQLRNEAE